MLKETQEELTSAHSVSRLLQLETISEACVENDLCSFWRLPIIQLCRAVLSVVELILSLGICVKVVLVDFFLSSCLRLIDLLLIKVVEATFINLAHHLLVEFARSRQTLCLSLFPFLVFGLLLLVLSFFLLLLELPLKLECAMELAVIDLSIRFT